VANIATPTFSNDKVFFTLGYGTGGGLLGALFVARTGERRCTPITDATRLLRPLRATNVFRYERREDITVVGAAMTQDPSEVGALVGPPLSADPAALWASFAPPLRAFLARRVPPGVEADDLLQDVFVRVVRHLGTLRGTDRPEAWLFQIARNALRDTLRARQRRDGRTDPLETDLPAEPDREAVRQAEAELAPCLTAMIGRLAEPYRAAIELTSLQGLTQADAARHAGISVSGMKSRVQRGREQLRHLLVTCCQIDVDVRGGVSDFHVRVPGACGDSNASIDAPGGCGSTPDSKCSDD
jgi:RNA polymerase sigma-70 factor (ECF subfamily)